MKNNNYSLTEPTTNFEAYPKNLTATSNFNEYLNNNEFNEDEQEEEEEGEGDDEEDNVEDEEDEEAFSEQKST